MGINDTIFAVATGLVQASNAGLAVIRVSGDNAKHALSLTKSYTKFIKSKKQPSVKFSKFYSVKTGKFLDEGL